MALLEILTYPDVRLREVSRPVTEVTPELKKLADDMLETMYDAAGIGLAAPQVNQHVRLLVIDIRPPAKKTEDKDTKNNMTELEKSTPFPLVLFNPEIINGEGKTTYDEGCLSVPGYYETVERYNKIQVKALNKEGESFTFFADGLLAICIQHEMDHLEGKLFIDRISFTRANKVKNLIKKQGYPALEEKNKNKSKVKQEAL